MSIEEDRSESIARAPGNEVVVPEIVRGLASGEQVSPVWENQLGGLTFEVGRAAGRRFVKWAKAGSGLDLEAERQRLEWAYGYTSVPRVISHGSDNEQSWMVTAAMDGESAVSERWKADPETAARAIGEQLRRFHDALPVDTCPFDWSVEKRLSKINLDDASDGLLNVPDWRLDYRGVSVEEALLRAAQAPEIDRLVVCHGDPCSPNTLITDDGQPAGVVDLDALGVADRWADLAVATWSTEWNYGSGLEQTLLDAYGIESDPERIEFYRLIWELG